MRFPIKKHKVAKKGMLVMVFLYIISIVVYILLKNRNYIQDTHYNGLIATTLLFYLLIISWLGILFADNPCRWNYMENEVIYTHGLGFYTGISYKRIKCIVIASQNPGPYNRYKYDKSGRKYAMLVIYASETHGRNIFPNQVISGDSIFEEELLCASYLKLADLEKLLKKTKANIYITEDMLWIYKEELFPLFVKNADRVIISFRTDTYGGFKHRSFMEYLSLLPK